MKKTILIAAILTGILMAMAPAVYSENYFEEEVYTGTCGFPENEEEAIVREAYDIALGRNEAQYYNWNLVREVASNSPSYKDKNLDQIHLEHYFTLAMEKVWGTN